MNVRPIHIFAQVSIVVITFLALLTIALGPHLPSAFDLSYLTGAQAADSANYKFVGGVVSGTSDGNDNYITNLHITPVGGVVESTNYQLYLGSTSGSSSVTGDVPADTNTNKLNIVIKQGSTIISNTGSVNLGQEVSFTPLNTQATQYLWYLGDTNDPWGTIQRVSIGGGAQNACQSTADTGDYCTSDYHGFGSGGPGDQPLGAPCVCASTDFYDNNLPMEYNVYPNSIIDVSNRNSVYKTFTSFDDCQTDPSDISATCSIKLVTKDSDGTITGEGKREIVLAGLPGDIGGTIDSEQFPIDGELKVSDTNLLYGVITSTVEAVEGNPDCDDNGEININDYVLLVRAVSEEKSCEELSGSA